MKQIYPEHDLKVESMLAGMVTAMTHETGTSLKAEESETLRKWAELAVQAPNTNMMCICMHQGYVAFYTMRDDNAA